MQDSDLILTCELCLRSYLLLFKRKNGKGLCGYVSGRVQHVLYILNIDTDMIQAEYKGQEHWLLQLRDGRYLDPTAGQFRKPIDNIIHLGALPENYVIIQNHGRNF